MVQTQSYRYVVIGAGLTGVSAVDGIREMDRGSPILLLGREQHLPYDRPPLTKSIWLGKKKVGDLFLHDGPYYRAHSVDFRPGVSAVEIDSRARTIVDSEGNSIRYERLLLATGGKPKRLRTPGGDLDGIFYYRTLSDYLRLRSEAKPGKTVVIIGGGFIGSELASSLRQNGLDVSMIFPESYPVNRVFPERLGLAVQEEFIRRGVHVFSSDLPVAIEKKDNGFVTRTKNGKALVSEILIVGVGIQPAVELAEVAGLRLEDGIVVNERLQTSDPDIYAAGDVACFPFSALGRSVRIEHWDHAAKQGRLAGRNMAGAGEIYDHLPYFFSDLFQFGYEAVGEIDPRLAVREDWEIENEKGVIYFHQQGRIRGVMMCNLPDRIEWARELVRTGAGLPALSFSKAA